MIHRSASSVLRRGRLAATATALIVAAGAAGPGTTLFAQGTASHNRVAVSLGGGYQVTANTLSQSLDFEQYSEPGSLTATYTTRRGPVAEAAVIVRVWRNFGVGVAASYFQDTGSAQVHALVPHPLTFNLAREINGPAAVSHRDIGMHLQAAYWAQLTRRIDMVVYGGPSVFRVEQDFVSDVAFSEVEPFDTAAYEGATVIRKRKSVTGANVGAEIGWRLARHVGLGAGLRFARAVADFVDTSSAPFKAGGLHLGGGLRILF
jgi:hypothetical protein